MEDAAEATEKPPDPELAGVEWSQMASKENQYQSRDPKDREEPIMSAWLIF